ncbi:MULTISPECIES: MFS transporter [Lysinibacillus]|uniref:MFS transporter n=1 Tax=Lysinibacillus antri TaxID=2498145 RepID=A0A432LGJ3_9BACI|nr:MULTISPECIES: MFS transporter [Lysinibacillus]RUL57095.1 MFS transporter [Lysinibacillus antri]TSI03271.1 MFS transporter [Lysinibacillus sp. BW-2-10]
MNNQHWLSQNYFIFFFTWGVYLQYWPGWLSEAKGLTVSEVGFIMGFGLVARAISTMFAFPFATKFMSEKKLILGLVISSLIVTILYLPANSFESLFVMTFLFSFIYPSLLPAIENSATTLMQHSTINYGKSRSYGSIGFVIAVLIISFIIGSVGEKAILWCMIGFLFIMLLMQTRPAPNVLLVKPTTEDRGKSSSMRGLFKIKGFPIILLIVILLQGSLASYYNYSYIYLQYLNVNTNYIGIILNIAVLSEIIYLMKADALSHWKTSTLLLVAGIGSTLRWIIIFSFPNIWAFILSQTLHSVSFAMAHFAFIQYISKTLPRQQLSNAQGVYSALGMSLSAALLTLFGGYLYEISPGLSFLGMIVFTIPAIFIVIATRKKYQY